MQLIRPELVGHRVNVLRAQLRARASTGGLTGSEPDPGHPEFIQARKRTQFSVFCGNFFSAVIWEIKSSARGERNWN